MLCSCFYRILISSRVVFKNVWSKPLNSQQLPTHSTSCDAVSILCYRSKNKLFSQLIKYPGIMFMFFYQNLKKELIFYKKLYEVIHDQIKKCQKCNSFSAGSWEPIGGGYFPPGPIRGQAVSEGSWRASCRGTKKIQSPEFTRNQISTVVCLSYPMC